jgi:alkylated DNA repair dioxygenase AlkB
MAVSELVVGISLGSPARMRFRRYSPKRRVLSIAMARAPGSIYRLESEGRWAWQHRIPPTPGCDIPSRFERCGIRGAEVELTSRMPAAALDRSDF